MNRKEILTSSQIESQSKNLAPESNLAVKKDEKK